MNDKTDREQASTARLRLPEALFLAFCAVLALLALVSFWPPRSAQVIVWLVLWVGLCLATGISILRRARHARIVIWALNTLAVLSAFAALSSGLLRGVGVVIDIALLIPMVWFAVWYQRSRR